ncbi:hypothetical protein ABIF50_008785 [Bradyrhizobium diazoefficiens]|jgi:hypothetical protein
MGLQILALLTASCLSEFRNVGYLDHPAHLEGDRMSSRFAHRVRMGGVDGSSREFSCDIDSQKNRGEDGRHR